MSVQLCINTRHRHKSVDLVHHESFALYPCVHLQVTKKSFVSKNLKNIVSQSQCFSPITKLFPCEVRQVLSILRGVRLLSPKTFVFSQNFHICHGFKQKKYWFSMNVQCLCKFLCLKKRSIFKCRHA